MTAAIKGKIAHSFRPFPAAKTIALLSLTAAAVKLCFVLAFVCVFSYIVKEDIIDIMRSLFLCFLKSGVASYDWNSAEFKAKYGLAGVHKIVFYLYQQSNT